GDRIAVVTNSGGPGILTSDRAEELGLEIAETSSSLQARLRGFLPPQCALANPVDLTVEGTRDNYRRVLEALLESEYDGAIAIDVSTPFLDSAALAQGICEAAARHPRKPVAAVFMAGQMVEPGCARLAQAGIPSFPTGERAAYVLAKMREYAREQERPGWRGGGGAGPAAPPGVPSTPLAASGPVLEPQAVAFLEEQGFRFPEHAFVTREAELEGALQQLGLPVVLKAVSPEILHKSEVGGIALGLDSPERVHEAFREMTRRLSSRGLRGVMLYRQLSGGVELIAGLKQDRDFGPVVIAGSGGVLTELLEDVSMRIAPFDREEAIAMLSELKAFRLLEGFRGQPPRDIGAAAELLASLSRLGLAYPQIRELDLNPVFVFERGAVAADVRIILPSAG
ncbi:MAG: acetate--CoA ligase family protein, partial [Spirochaetales bacterium]|nr:acetate--CoA ligase family protein [Spirochaetales bacterium]